MKLKLSEFGGNGMHWNSVKSFGMEDKKNGFLGYGQISIPNVCLIKEYY